MALETTLNRDRYFWTSASLTATDDAILTVTVTGPPHPARVALEIQLGSAMLAITPVDGGRRTGTGITIDLGDLSASAKRTVQVRVHPRQATRPGRRRVAVVRVIADGAVIDSTTVWARVERQG